MTALLAAETAAIPLPYHCLAHDPVTREDEYLWRVLDASLLNVESQVHRSVWRAHLSVLDELEHAFLATKDVERATTSIEPLLRRTLQYHASKFLPYVLEEGWNQAARLIDRGLGRPRLFPVSGAKAPFNVSIMFDLSWPALSRYIQERPRAYSIPTAATSIMRFRNAMQAGVDAGEGIQEIVRSIVRMQLPEVSRRRATMIARTEVIGGSNYSSLQSYIASEVVRAKGWLYTRDGKTRDTHVYSGIVPLKEPFILSSGAQLMHPGDTSLGAGLEEIVNCRCTMKPVVKRVRRPAGSSARPARPQARIPIRPLQGLEAPPTAAPPPLTSLPRG